MERKPLGRDFGLSARMAVCLGLLASLYFPFLVWLVAIADFAWGGWIAVLVAFGALGLLAASPYLSELLTLRLAGCAAPGS